MDCLCYKLLSALALAFLLAQACDKGLELESSWWLIQTLAFGGSLRKENVFGDSD